MNVAIVAHSGGPTPVINASLLGLVEEARLHPEIGALYGARFGLPGIFREDFIDLFAQPEDLMHRIGASPASALGSSRYEVSQADLSRVLAIFRSRNVRFFFYTGGNGSMGTAMQLKQAAEQEGLPLQIIGIPKTIDNDLLITDHTPGYGSTARFFAHAVRDIDADNRSLPNQVEIIEVLGRNAGWLAAAASFAKSGSETGPHLIYFPEQRLPIDKLMDDVASVFTRLKRCVVVVCEGQLDQNSEAFGADVRSGSRGFLAQNLGHRLASLIASRLNIRARSEKPGLLGRASSAYVSQSDWNESRLCGRQAVKSAVAEHSGVMITLVRGPGPDYSVSCGEARLEEVAFTERLFPAAWINSDGTGVLPDYRTYAHPLVGSVDAHPQLIASHRLS